MTHIHFNIRLVRPGDRYGRDDCLTHNGDEPLIEFYDPRYAGPDFGPLGQFVSRYYVSTINDATGGLDLQGDVPSWKVSAAQMNEIRKTLRAMGFLRSMGATA